MKQLLKVFIVFLFLSFTLSSQPFKIQKAYPKGSAEFEFWHYKQKFKLTKDTNDKADLTYPKMINFKDKSIEEKVNSVIFNKDMVQEANEFYKEFDENDFDHNVDGAYYKTVDFVIFLNESNILSMEQHTFYSTGGAHGDGYFTGYIFDLNNGKQLKLTDLLDGNYSSILKKMNIKALIDKYQTDTNEVSLSQFSTSDNIYLKKDSICFRYTTYELGSYDMGAPCICLSFNELKPYIKKGSVIERLISVTKTPDKPIKIALKAFDGKYVSIANQNFLNFLGSSPGNKETFEMITHPDGKVSFKGSNNKYVTVVYSTISTDLKADASGIGENEKFILIKHPDGKISLQTNKGKFIRAAKTFLENALKLDRDAAGNQEKFELIITK